MYYPANIFGGFLARLSPGTAGQGREGEKLQNSIEPHGMGAIEGVISSVGREMRCGGHRPISFFEESTQNFSL